MRDPKPLAGCLDERIVESALGANAAPWTRKSSPPNSSSMAAATSAICSIVGDVAWPDQRADRRREVGDVFLQPLALVGQRQPRAGTRRSLSDRPGDRPLVRNTDDQTVLSREIRHRAMLGRGVEDSRCGELPRLHFERLRPEPWRRPERNAGGRPPPGRDIPPPPTMLLLLPERLP